VQLNLGIGLSTFMVVIDWMGKGSWFDVWFIFCGLTGLFWGFYLLDFKDYLYT